MTQPIAPPSAASVAADWGAIPAILAPYLAEAAGPGAKPVSIALEFAGADATAEALVCRAWVERATRTLVFMGAEARRPDHALVAAATAVFRRT